VWRCLSAPAALEELRASLDPHGAREHRLREALHLHRARFAAAMRAGGPVEDCEGEEGEAGPSGRSRGRGEEGEAGPSGGAAAEEAGDEAAVRAAGLWLPHGAAPSAAARHLSTRGARPARFAPELFAADAPPSPELSAAREWFGIPAGALRAGDATDPPPSAALCQLKGDALLVARALAPGAFADMFGPAAREAWAGAVRDAASAGAMAEVVNQLVDGIRSDALQARARPAGLLPCRAVLPCCLMSCCSPAVVCSGRGPRSRR
jgi:hypothetical protein